jgi:hypothetical protein
VTRLALQSRCRGLRESNSSRLEELPPLVGSIFPVFGVASSMRLIHLLGCILEKKDIGHSVAFRAEYHDFSCLAG